jgi:hypothetical protein
VTEQVEIARSARAHCDLAEIRRQDARPLSISGLEVGDLLIAMLDYEI